MLGESASHSGQAGSDREKISKYSVSKDNGTPRHINTFLSHPVQPSPEIFLIFRNLNISTSALHSSVLQTEIFLSAASASGKLCIPPLVGAVRKMNLFRDRPTPRSSSVSSTAGATWGDLGHPGSVTPPGCRHSHRAKPREATSHSTSAHLSSALWWAVK